MNLLSLTEELRIIFNSPVNKRFFPEKSIIKFLMRVGLITSTVLIITSAQLLFAGPVKSQSINEVMVTLGLKNETLIQAFQKIEASTDYHFMYRKNEVKNIRNLNLPVTKLSIEDFLKIVLAKTSLTYRQVKDQILIMQSKNSTAYSISPDGKIPYPNDPVANVVTGKVTDSKDNPLVGVSISVKGTKIGTSTDKSGNYQIDVAPNGTLIFSFVGFISQEVEVNNRSVININLKEESKELSEVVVTALGIKRQVKSLGYSTTEIPGSNLTESRTANLANALSGQIAGVSVAGTGTGPNGSTRITIRGNTSLTGGGTPLYVIDGVPFDAENQGSSGKWGGPDYGDALSTINPDDIESINVLKGVAGSALYGYRGGNGVIIITTKSGSAAKGFGVELNDNLTASNLIDERDFQYVYGQGSNGLKPTTVEEAQNTSSDSWGAKIDGSNVTDILGNMVPYVAHKDNFKNFYKTGVNNQASVALSGRNANGNFRLGVTNVNSSEVVPNAGTEQQGVNFNSSYNFTDRLHLNFTASYQHEKVKNRPWNSDAPGSVIASTFFIGSTFDIRTLSPAVDANGDEILPGGPTNIYFDNAYFVANYFKNTTDRNRYTGNITLKYDITNWLSLQGQVSRNSILADLTNIVPYGTAWQHSGSLDVSSSNNRELDASFMFDINKKFGSDFSLHANLGGNHEDNLYKANSTGGGLDLPYWYSVNNIVSHVYNIDFSEYKVNSFYGSADVGYKDYLFASFTGRNDWFSTLNPKTDNVFYPSVSGSFVFSDAFHMPAWITFGKLRASWAKSSAGTSPYRSALTYSNMDVAYNDIIFSSISQSTVPNAFLKPIDIKETEIGLSMSFFNNRFSIDAAVYNKRTDDDILDVSISNTSGYESAVQNIGKLRNRGLELLLNGVALQTKNFSWSPSFNIAFNDSKVLFLSPGVSSLVLGDGDPARFGNFSIRQVVGQEYGQLFGYAYLRDDKGNKIFGPDGLPLRTDDLVSLGSGVYKTTGGFSNDFKYKNFVLSTLLDFKFGAKIYSVTNAELASIGLHKKTLAGREGGYVGVGVTQDGKVNTTAVDAQTYWQSISGESGEGVDNIEEEYTYDASFIKLRNVSLGYSLPQSVLKHSFIKGLTISLVGRNLAILLKHIPNIDPESNLTSTVEQGVEYNPYPAIRQLGFNLNVKF
jgi:TonB-linked SusC/RagA family outer membrane protein